MFSCFLGYTFVVVYHPLIAAVHKVYLYSRNAPVGKSLKEIEVILDGKPW